ncbi:MAG: hypothetical protein WBO16_15385 [Gammaproteobacteria bacterium]
MINHLAGLSQIHKKNWRCVFALVMVLHISIGPSNTRADDLRAAVQNPISSLVSLPFKFNFDYGAQNGDGTILNIQPVYPITKGKWNYVSRLILPVASVDGAISTPENPNPSVLGSASGLGDTNYSLYLSPVEYGDVIWGVGPSLMMPTASDDQLGSGKSYLQDRQAGG